MVRMLTYGISRSANEILGSSLSPAAYCICKKTAIAKNAQEVPLQPFDQNRLVPVKVAGMTYGVAKKHHVILQYENETTIPGCDLWLEEGAAIPNPAHPDKTGWDPAGWTPSKPATATQDGTYRQQYTRKQYTITFVIQSGEVTNTYYYGDPVYAPDPNTLSGWRFDGWDPSFVDGTPATANARYVALYTYLNPGSVPGEDLPHDDDGHSGRDGADSVVYVMDNMGQAIDPIRIDTGNLKPAPTYGLKNCKWTGVVAQHLGVPEGTSVVPSYQGQPTWWSGPIDGLSADTHGVDEGISAGDVPGRKVLDEYVWAETDSCVYEYGKPNTSSLPYSEDNVHYEHLLSNWSCPCYKDGQNIGNFTIHSDVDWIKFAVIQWHDNPSEYDGLTCPFSVMYFIHHNDGSEPRCGTVTVTTPGGKANYNINNWNPSYNKPYATEGRVYFYQLGRE